MNYAGIRMGWQEFRRARGSDIRKMHKWLTEQLERERKEAEANKPAGK